MPARVVAALRVIRKCVGHHVIDGSDSCIPSSVVLDAAVLPEARFEDCDADVGAVDTHLVHGIPVDECRVESFSRGVRRRGGIAAVARVPAALGRDLDSLVGVDSTNVISAAQGSQLLYAQVGRYGADDAECMCERARRAAKSGSGLIRLFTPVEPRY